MKKIVSILVVLAMLASMVPAVFAAEDFSGTFDAVKGKVYTTDTWTATEAGALTISVSAEEGVGYKVYWNGESQSLGYNLTYGDVVTYQAAEGDEFYLEVKGQNPSSWANCDATITYSFSFAAGGIAKEAYIISEQTITTEGTHTVDMIETAEVTIVAVTPTETGVYTITVGEDALIANLGGTSAYIHDWANAEHVTSLEWTCGQVAEEYEATFEDGTTEIQTSEGQSLMLGIVSNSETVDVTVEKTGDYESVETPLYTYENKASLSQFEVPADATVGAYVDVYGDTHTAVLGEDGYYHLDSVDGDILLVDMNYIAVLSDALRSERPVMYAYVTLEDGSKVKYDIGDAVQAYEAVCDSNGYYPLTEDLIFFYDTYAAGVGIYSFYLEEGFNADCAWMFACLTMALPEEEEPVIGSGTEDDPYIITSLPYEFVASFKNDNQASNGIYYQYTVEKDGVIEIKDLYDDNNTGTLSIVADDPIHINDLAGYEVTAGEVLLLCHWAIWAGDYDVTLQYAETTSGGGSEEGGDEGGEGSEGDSSEIPTVVEKTVWTGVNESVSPDAPVEITFIAGVNGTVTVKDLSGVDSGWEFYIRSEESIVDSRLSSDEISYNGDSKTETLVAGSLCTITICAYDEVDWVWLEGEISYTVEFIPEGESGGEEEEPAEDGTLVIGYNFIELPVDADSVEYTFTATETGTLHIIATYVGWDSDGSGVYDDDTEYIVDDFTTSTNLAVNGTVLENYYYGSVEVVAGETYTFTWTDVNQWFDWGWEATLNLSYSDELIPVKGSADLPIELYPNDCPTESIEIATGGDAYYTLYGFSGMTFTITGENVSASLESYDYMTDTITAVDYEAVNGVVEIPISGWGAVNVVIHNEGTASAVYALNAYYPVGSQENPAELAEGDNVTDIAEGGVYYYNWTATCNGTMTIAVSGEHWDYVVNNLTTSVYGDWNNTYADPQVDKMTVEFKTGDLLEIVVGTLIIDELENYTNPASVITLNVTVEYAHEPEGEGVHTEGTCTEDSTITYTCAICGETYVVIDEEAPGHNFVDGECTVCGAPEVTLGDVNGDGKINMFDAAKVVSYYTGKAELSESELAAADMNDDGKINMFDAAKIVAIYTGK